MISVLAPLALVVMANFSIAVHAATVESGRNIDRVRLEVLRARMLPKLQAFRGSLSLASLQPRRPLPTVRYTGSGWEPSIRYQGPGGERYNFGLEQTLVSVAAEKKTDILEYQTAVRDSILKSRLVMRDLQTFVEEEKKGESYTEHERSRLETLSIQAAAAANDSRKLEDILLKAIETSGDQLKHANSEYVQMSRSFRDSLDAGFKQSLKGKIDSIQEMMASLEDSEDAARARGPVRFHIVATNEADIAGILQTAKPLADLNLYGREVVQPSAMANPTEKALLDAWVLAAGMNNPGAVVINGNGTLSDVLSIEDARNAGVVEGSFVDAAR